MNGLWPYTAAVALVLSAAWLRLALDPVLGEAYRFTFFYAAVPFVAWRLGLRPGLLALAVSAVTANYLLFPPVWTPSTDTHALFGLVFFTGIGSGLVLLADGFRQSTARVLAKAAELNKEIMERKTADAEVSRLNALLQERVEELEALIDSSPIAIGVASDPACEHIWANSAFADILGVPDGRNISKSSLRTGPLPFKVYRHGRELAASDLPMQFCAKQGVRLQGVELEIVRDAGKPVTLLGNVAPLHRSTGEIRGCVAAFLDISERRAAEREREEVNRRKDEFLATLSHELRNPLAPLRNAASLLERAQPGSAKVRWACDVIGRQVGHLSRLVDDLMDVSVITQGLIALKKEPVDLRALIRQAIELAQPLLDQRNQRLRLDLPAHALLAQADGARIVQAIANVLVNAVKFTPPQGSIHVIGQQDDAAAIVTVRDTGIGIPHDLLPKVFELFTQGERSLARAEGGLGVGLARVKKVIEMHEGTVEARSAGRGKGAEFVLTLPLFQRADTPDLAAEERRSPSKILVVDDNPDIADTLTVLLRMNGYEVRAAYTGEAALELARDFNPAIALLDIGLPGIDGYEVARRFKSDPALRQARLVAITGYGREADRVRSAGAGFERHLTKPCDPDYLLALIEHFLTPPPAQPPLGGQGAPGRPEFQHAPS